MLNLVWVLFFFSIKRVYWLGQATLLICASAVSYINRDSSHPPKRMTEDYNELLSISPSRHLCFSLTHIHQCLAHNQFSSVAQSCPTLFDSMDCSTPGVPINHQLLKSTQTHVHRVGDVIQPSHPLSSRSPALNLSQHQGLFKWVSSSHQVAKVLKFQLQHQSFQWTPRTDLL